MSALDEQYCYNGHKKTAVTVNKRGECKICKAEVVRRYRAKHLHPCLDCGTAVNETAQRCHRCAGKVEYKRRAEAKAARVGMR